MAGMLLRRRESGAGRCGSRSRAERPPLRQRVGRDATTLTFICGWLCELVFAMGLRRQFFLSRATRS